MIPKVIDLSHHNVGPRGGPIDFVALAGFGVAGVILKASQGTRYVDPTFAERREAAAAAGLLVGAYHFATGDEPDAQVAHFLSVAAPDDSLLMALDHEPNRGNQLDLAGARGFLATLAERLGRQAVLYSGNLIKEQLRAPDPFFNAHRLWLAHYNDRPRLPPGWPAPWLHQFSGDGVNSHGIIVPGIDAGQAGKIDMNAYAGSDEQLAAEWTS